MRDAPAVTDLVTQATNGDKPAWDALVDRYAPLIWAICQRHRLSRAGASDVGQAVWLQAADQLSGTSFVRGWIRFWVGDLVGILVTAPLILAATDAERRRTLAAIARSPEAWLQVAMLVAVVWTMFAVYRENAARLFYLARMTGVPVTRPSPAERVPLNLIRFVSA
mgnify:CR=1 FL=1